jgi:OOP family OmpA-OmpF porin
MVLALALSTAGAVHAADSEFYFGASGGQARYDFEPLRLTGPVVVVDGPVITPSLAAEWLTAFRTSPTPQPFNSYAAVSGLATPQRVFWIPGKDDESTSWNLLAGYRFFRYAAIELAYHDFGTLHEFSPARTIGPITTLEVKSELESTGATLSLLGELPITDRWSVFLRAGGLFADQDVTRRFNVNPLIGTSTAHESYHSEVFLYGIGTQFDFGAHWTVRLDFQRYDDVGKGNGVGEADIDVLTLGVLFRLGGT